VTVISKGSESETLETPNAPSLDDDERAWARVEARRKLDIAS
jgi:hypothetical protein